MNDRLTAAITLFLLIQTFVTSEHNIVILCFQKKNHLSHNESVLSLLFNLNSIAL